MSQPQPVTFLELRSAIARGSWVLEELADRQRAGGLTAEEVESRRQTLGALPILRDAEARFLAPDPPLLIWV